MVTWFSRNVIFVFISCFLSWVGKLELQFLWLHEYSISRVHIHFLFIPCRVSLLNVTQKRIVYARCFVNHVFFVSFFPVSFLAAPASASAAAATATVTATTQTKPKEFHSASHRITLPCEIMDSKWHDPSYRTLPRVTDSLENRLFLFFFDLLCKYAARPFPFLSWRIIIIDKWLVSCLPQKNYFVKMFIIFANTSNNMM